MKLNLDQPVTYEDVKNFSIIVLGITVMWKCGKSLVADIKDSIQRRQSKNS